MIYRPLYSNLPKIRKDSANKIASYLISHKRCTRRDIAEYASISDMSASKAVASLFDSGIISEKEQKNPVTKRPCGVISISQDNTYIIIDISGKAYTAYSMNCDFNVTHQYNYKYQSIFSQLDNLSIFLERAHKNLSDNISHFNGICVIIRKDLDDLTEILNMVERNFSHKPDAVIDIGDAVYHLAHSNVDYHLPVNSLFYINIGSGCESYFISGDQIMKCNPHKLIGKNNTLIGDMIDSCVSATELYEIIFDIFNCASAMLDPEVLALESDRFVLGSTMAFNLSKKLKINFPDRRRLLISDKLPHLYIKGALLALIHTLIVDILSSSN